MSEEYRVSLLLPCITSPLGITDENEKWKILHLLGYPTDEISQTFASLTLKLKKLYNGKEAIRDGKKELRKSKLLRKNHPDRAETLKRQAQTKIYKGRKMVQESLGKIEPFALCKIRDLARNFSTRPSLPSTYDYI